MADVPSLPGLSGERRVRIGFDERLHAVEDRFISAAIRVADAMPTLTHAFLRGDKGAIAEAEAMADEVRAAIRGVEDEGFIILARESPVGRDLRLLVALLRLATDVERSGSLLLHVSEAARYLDPQGLPESLRSQLHELADASTEVFRAGIDAWRQRDGLAIADVDMLDHRVDSLQSSVLTQCQDQDDLGRELLVLGLVARYLERIADHGVALARDVAFVVTGERAPRGD